MNNNRPPAQELWLLELASMLFKKLCIPLRESFDQAEASLDAQLELNPDFDEADSPIECFDEIVDVMRSNC